MQGTQLRTANKRKGVYLSTKKDSAEHENIPTPSHTIKIYARRNFFTPKATLRELLSTPACSSLRLNLLANNSVTPFLRPSNITSTSSMALYSCGETCSPKVLLFISVHLGA